MRTRAELARRRAFLDLQLSPPQGVQVVAADLIGLRDQRAEVVVDGEVAAGQAVAVPGRRGGARSGPLRLGRCRVLVPVRGVSRRRPSLLPGLAARGW